MKRLQVGDEAPDFALPDHKGVVHQLSHLLESKSVLLVFNIGFA